MVERETTDGVRIAQLLSSEIHGHTRGALDQLDVVDADTDVEPTEFGAFAYGIEGGGKRLSDVYVHPDRAHLAFRVGMSTAVEVAEREGLRVRPKAAKPPQTLVFVENGAEVKRALAVLRAVAAERLDEVG